MNRSPVWISGVGAVSSAGADVPSTLASFHAGVRHHSTTLPFQTTISCPTFQVTADVPALFGRNNTSRTLRLAMMAVREALSHAGVDRFAPGTRVGVCMGTTIACQLNSLPFYAAYRRRENPPLDRVYDFLRTNLAQAIADMLGVIGPRLTVANACSSGADAIGVASSWIRAGLCDVAIAGGADEMYQVPVAGFWSLGVMCSQLCSPFDRDRSGLNLGEGAGVFILESEAYARSAGRTYNFELAGFGAASDAHHLTAPHPEGRGLDSAIRIALAQANINTDRIAFINAHGTATLDNDRTEGKVIQRLFGDTTPFLSTKGFTGHTLGAAGGLEAVFTLLGLREGWISPSVGFQNPAADIPLAPVQERTPIDGDYALSTSLAFGGNNAAVIIRRRRADSHRFSLNLGTPHPRG
ncbi:MAG TPA: beta-ketoacyl-[acyl-carrier-protein] synthase family protein [Tepidisphaeraceae bacterium]|jgi:3-oxoacyl-(acyl-carrier-protein) synthase|nr:beta-ketoacyl-[acyl-carrier-protein] synthase family protein [Tepidisphaeraceae bacterium]